MNDKNDVVLQLEALVDAHGLTHVLTGLSLMCFEKAEHLRSNWQDGATAKAWDRTGRALERFTTHAAVETCPLS